MTTQQHYPFEEKIQRL